MLRASLTRSRPLEHYSRLASSEGGQQQQQPGKPHRNHEFSVSHALSMLECDAKVLTSPLAPGYAWFGRLHFPMLEYVHALRYLRNSSSGGASRRVWCVLGENYEAQAGEPKPGSPSLGSACGGDGDSITEGTRVGDGGATDRVGHVG